MRTTYVLDTSALICNPSAWNNYPNCNVIIPIAVLTELDKLKKQPGEVGKNARVCIRLLDKISDNNDISMGVLLDNDIMLSFDAVIRNVEDFGDTSYGDSHILACAHAHWSASHDSDVVLVSNDINLRVKAKARGIDAVSQENSDTVSTDLYSGVNHITHEDAAYDLLENGCIDPTVYGLDINPNECVTFLDADGESLVSARKTAANKVKVLKAAYPWGIKSRNKEQSFAIDLMMDPNISLVTMTGSAGCGKAQPLDAKVLTPQGFVSMADIKIGSLVSTPDGSYAKVIDVFPQGKIDIYKISFSDGTSTECCENHLWNTRTSPERDLNKPYKTRTTKEIKKSIFYGKQNKKNHSIPISMPIYFDKKDLVLDPYAFGCLLGDGSFRWSLSYTSSDDFIIKQIEKSFSDVGMKIHKNKKKFGYSVTPIEKIKRNKQIISNLNGKVIKTYNNINDVELDGYSVSQIYKAIRGNKQYKQINWSFGNLVKNEPILIKYLKDNNLWMKKSKDKFIPNDYKFSSINDRISLLQGLMDTDGTISANGLSCEFNTISLKLANDVRWLVQSLGGTAKISNKKINYNYKWADSNPDKICYRVTLVIPNNIIPFKLPRKINRVVPRVKYFPRRYITGVDFIGKKEAQCILIDSKDHLYITNDCIVTHNTIVTLASALELVINKHEYNKCVIYRPIQPVGKDIGFLPGTAEEKLGPWFQAIMDNFEVLFTSNVKHGGDWKRDFEMLQKKGRIEMEAITYIRGRSITNALIIIDEAQNLSKEEVKTILTRVGENTKIVLTGDIEQIDNNDLDAVNNGLTYVIEKFKDSDLAGHITFTQGERSKLATKAAEIL
jgi:predicted ribonuclease YlaK